MKSVFFVAMVLPGVTSFGGHQQAGDERSGGCPFKKTSLPAPSDFPSYESSECVQSWGKSLLTAEELAREPVSNERTQSCDSSTKLAQDRQKLFDTQCEMYGFKECNEVADAYTRPEWEACMGPALNAEQWKEVVQPNCLGPLSDLLGIWVGDAGKSYSAVPQYSPTAEDEGTFLVDGVGLMAGAPAATFHAIKNQTYKELIEFTPILGNVRNRGYADNDHINPRCQTDQLNQGVKYTLTVIQTSPSDADGEYGGILHDETGMLMYNSKPAPGAGGGELDDFKLMRMANIPHGVSFVAEGTNGQTVTGADAKQKLLAEQEATYMNIQAIPQTCVPNDDYTTINKPWGSKMDGSPQPGVYPYDDLTPFLVNETKKLQNVKSYTHMVMATEDLAQTKFIRNQAETVDLKYDMWISDVTGEDGKDYKQLQYTQFAKFAFQQRFDCLICEGGTKDANGCYGLGSCDARYEKEFTNPSGKKAYSQFEGMMLNQIPPIQHGQCFNCKPDPACEKERGGGKMFWPHIQVNTLRKVTADTDPEILELYKNIETFGKLGRP